MTPQIFPYGTPLNIVWQFANADGTIFNIAGYTYRLFHRVGNNETEVNSSQVTASGDTISFIFPADDTCAPGTYSVRLVLFQNGSHLCTINYNSAFVLSRLASGQTRQDQNLENNIVHLFTVAEYYLHTSVIPTVGDDGYWYVNGQIVIDGHGNYVSATHTMRYDPETKYLIIDEGRVDSHGESIQQTITDVAAALADWEQRYGAAETARDTAYQTAEGSKSGSSAGDGSRWGDYKSAEAGRNTDYNSAEGSRDTSYGTAEGNRNTQYSTAESARDGRYATAEGSRNTSYGTAEGSRNSQYSSAESARDGRYATAEQARNTAAANQEGTQSGSVAGDGTRWGAYKSAEDARQTAYGNKEDARDTAYGNKEDARDAAYVIAEGGRDTLYGTAETARDTQYAGAEGTQNGSVAGDGSRWGTFKTNEAARDQEVQEAISHFDETKADKVSNAVEDNFAALDGNGNLKDSGHKHSDYLTQHQDISGKADKVQGGTENNFAALDANGNLKDSGHKHGDYLVISTKYGASINLTIDDQYHAVADPTGKNPASEGWFERSGTDPNYVYTKTTDTTPVSGKTYYTAPTYVLTAQLKDQDGNNLGNAKTIDLPLESVVVSGRYDSNTKKIILTLQDGSTIEVPVGDLISGLQPTIDSDHKLSADLVADGETNKVYTATEKQKLSGITEGAEPNVQSDWNQTNSDADDYIKNKPTIPDISGKADKVSGGTENNFAALDANGNLKDSGHKHSDYLTEHQDISGKANKSEMSVTDGTGADADKTTIQLKDGTSATVLKSHQDISGKVDKVQGKGLSTNDYTTAEKEKLGGIASGAEVNVQSDWSQSDDSADDFIKNKPTSMKNPAALTFGQKTYDGSEEKEITASDLGALTQHQDISGKADKVSGATNGNFAGLDANGNLADSGKKSADFATAAQGAKADAADTLLGALGLSVSDGKVCITFSE